MEKQNIDLVLVSRQDYIEVFESLIDCLRNGGHNGQANFVEKLKNLIDEGNIASFVEQITSVNMWGGAGAVWEVYFHNANEGKLFQKEMIRLIDLMVKTNISQSRVNSIRTLFDGDLYSK